MKVNRVAVLGAGTMGARIAALFATVGVPSVLLDVSAAAAESGVQRALSSRPEAFGQPADAGLIQTGSFDDLAPLQDCDWIIEAVAEDLQVKRHLLERVIPFRSLDAAVSTNTSGISLRELADGMPEDFGQHFCGVHFFNPPRQLKLVEMIPGEHTSPGLFLHLKRYCEDVLGKGVVVCKDTPNFIANRMGAFFSSVAQRLTIEFDLSIEEADFLTGPLIGVPKSGTYRLLDIVGLDVWGRLTRHLEQAVPHDPFHGEFRMAPFLMELERRGWLGDKTKQGCYKRRGDVIEVLDRNTFEYRPMIKPAFTDLPSDEDLGQRLRALIAQPTAAGRFVWELLSRYIQYAAWTAAEIANDPEDLDRAMRWGYAHALGPFEIWDALGREQTRERMSAEGKALP